jgi:hypothetical protein
VLLFDGLAAGIPSDRSLLLVEQSLKLGDLRWDPCPIVLHQLQVLLSHRRTASTPADLGPEASVVEDSNLWV